MANKLIRELIQQIVADIPQGSRITFRQVAAAPRVQNRVIGAARSEGLIARAKETRLDDGTPFWHALFNLGEDLPDGIPLEIAQSAMFHQEPRDDPFVVFEVTPRLGEEVATLSESVQGRDSLAMDSRVELPDGSIRYIPMLDFSVKSSKRGGAATAQACVQAIALPGLLVASGRSFHFYGRSLLDGDEQIRFWARALLLTPIVDERWIAHQILGGRAALRISQNERGDVPRIIWELGTSSI